MYPAAGQGGPPEGSTTAYRPCNPYVRVDTHRFIAGKTDYGNLLPLG